MKRVLVFCLLASCLLFSFAANKFEDIFQCNPIPPQENPTDVRRLRPSDIKVVMAAGDSMTAGFAMDDRAWIFTAVYEYRGHAASIGGDPGAITVPNFLKAIGAKDLKGASVGRGLPWDALERHHEIIRPHNPPVDKLNAAQSMAKLNRVSGDQIDYLVSYLHNSTDINFEKDWKMLTILVGANDLCVCCDGRKEATPDEWAKKYNETIAIIKQRIPRVFVNIVTMFNISQVMEVTKNDKYCQFVFSFVTECPCLKRGDDAKRTMDEYASAYSKKLLEISKYWQSLGDREFYVSTQTYTMNMVIPDRNFLSGLDCFHPSLSANVGMAIGLWNSMMLPPGQKPTNVSFDSKIICPDENTFLQ